MCQGLSRYLSISVNETKISTNSLEVPGLGFSTVTAGAQVCFLVRELRSCKLCSMAKTNTHKKMIIAPVKFTCILTKETNNKHNK